MLWPARFWHSAIENVFSVCIAWCKHERGLENSRQLCKPSTSSWVCITVENSPNPSRVYIRLCKHRKKVFYCFYKIISSKKYSVGKIYFTDQNVSSYNVDFTMRFLNWPMKSYISKSGYILSCKHAPQPIRARALS